MSNDNNMTNKELASNIAHRMGITPYQAMKFIGTMADIINENAENGNGTKIARVGTITITEVAQRESRSINTGEKIIIPSHDVVKFTAARRLRSSVKEH